MLIFSEWFNPDLNLFLKNNEYEIYVDNININQSEYKKIFIVTEPRAIKLDVYNFIKNNSNIFYKIITYDEEFLTLNNSIKCLYGTSWVLSNNNLKVENIDISFIVGGKCITNGHRLRHEIYYNLNKINKYIDTFISSAYPIENKYNNKILYNDKNIVFSNYAYHLTIENSKQKNYFTEKIIDCFQTMTVPIYYGAQNIGEYFDINGIIILEYDDIDYIINKLNEINLDIFYKDNILSIKKNYELSFNYLDYDCRLIKVINDIDNNDNK